MSMLILLYHYLLWANKYKSQDILSLLRQREMAFQIFLYPKDGFEAKKDKKSKIFSRTI